MDHSLISAVEFAKCRGNLSSLSLSRALVARCSTAVLHRAAQSEPIKRLDPFTVEGDNEVPPEGFRASLFYNYWQPNNAPTVRFVAGRAKRSAGCRSSAVSFETKAVIVSCRHKVGAVSSLSAWV